MLRSSGSYPRCRYMYPADSSAFPSHLGSERSSTIQEYGERRLSFTPKPLHLLSFPYQAWLPVYHSHIPLSATASIWVPLMRGWRSNSRRFLTLCCGMGRKGCTILDAWHKFSRRVWHRPSHCIIAQYDGSNASRWWLHLSRTATFSLRVVVAKCRWWKRRSGKTTVDVAEALIQGPSLRHPHILSANPLASKRYQ